MLISSQISGIPWLIIDQQAIHPSEGKVQAIKSAQNPKNLTELNAYLGLITYYGKFLLNLANFWAPLYDLGR